ncbi:AAA family ATPase [Candidatus Micrarchaeota archaeon]|nr:AAA family ATPase [Candidatus Micrarchaeota archaeon]MBI5176464.1 AAA family ATPase [Candidatus Micrarchaeota archaeon]
MPSALERVPTGIAGLDQITNGGFLRGSTVLLSGEAGCGKTILSLQFLYNGALDGEPGLYVTVEEPDIDLFWNMKNFGWDLVTLDEKNLFHPFKLDMFERCDDFVKIDETVQKLAEVVDQTAAKRVVIDSLTAFTLYSGDRQKIRYMVHNLASMLRKKKVTSILTCEIKRGQISRFGVEDFIADGVIMLYNQPANRAIHVRKLRGVRHDSTIHPYFIGGKGIEVQANEQVMWDSVNR